MTDLKLFFEKALSKSLGKTISIKNYEMVGGGCINNTASISLDQGMFFIKWNNASWITMFEKESAGLQILRESKTVRIPEILGCDSVDQMSFLLLEQIDVGVRQKQFWTLFGRQLAALHKNHSDQFGLDHDNYIGRLYQNNQKSANWIEFFIHNRLNVQIKMARDDGKLSKSIIDRFDVLFEKLENILVDEPASLIHGDLWSGNFMVSEEGLPVLIDPAVYFGNREIEIAFTQLFGGFDQQFYQSYLEAYPLVPGFEVRADIYNLYPLLVHLNLFGAGYLSGITNTLGRFT